MPYTYKLKSDAISAKHLLEAATGDRHIWWVENDEYCVERAERVPHIKDGQSLDSIAVESGDTSDPAGG